MRLLIIILFFLASQAALFAQKWTNYTNTNSIRSGTWFHGNLWLAAQDGGLVRYDPTANDARVYTAADGFAGVPSAGILITSAAGDKLYYILNKDIRMYDGQSWTDIPAPTAGPVEVKRIITATTDKLGNLILSSGLNNATQDFALLRFNGNTWESTIYRNPDTALVIVQLLQHPDGSIWAGGYITDKKNGYSVSDVILHIRDSGISFFYREDGLWEGNNGPVLSLDANGKLWATQYLGISSFDGISWKRKSIISGWTKSIPKASGEIWFGGSQLASFKTGNGFQIDTALKALLNFTRINDMKAVNNELWVGTDKGIGIRNSDGEWKTYTAADGLQGENIQFFFGGGNNVAAIAAWTGEINMFKDGEWNTWKRENSIQSGIIFKTAEDANGKIWTITSKGISILDGEKWKSYSKQELGVQSPQNIIIDQDNQPWIVALDGVVRFNGSAWSRVDIPGAEQEEFRTGFMDRNRNIWIASRFSLYRYNAVTDTWTEYSNETASWPKILALSQTEIIQSSGFRDITMDEKGNIWAIAGQTGLKEDPYKGGLYKYDGSQWAEYDLNDGNNRYRTQEPQQIEVTQDGSVWIRFAGNIPSGSQPGGIYPSTLSKLKDGSWTHSLTKNLSSFTFDSRGNLWYDLASPYNGFEEGLYVRNSALDIVKKFTPRDGLLPYMVYDLSFDDKGTLWIATSGGLSKLEYELTSVVNEEKPLEASFGITLLTQPVHDKMQLRLTEILSGSLKIYNLNGTEVTDLTSLICGANCQMEFSVSHLNSGMYIIQWKDGKNFLNYPFLVLR